MNNAALHMDVQISVKFLPSVPLGIYPGEELLSISLFKSLKIYT